MISIASPQISDEEKQAVIQVLDSGQLAQGPRVKDFEEQFANWCGTKFAIATSSGTTALHVALLAHGIIPGDEVITTSFSFIASSNCILFVGARPVFADIEPNFFSLDPADVEKRITPNTKAIIPVHIFGQACNMDAINELAEKYNLTIIEDACQAHGAKYNGKKVGAWGTACYSFYPTKNMTTIEGGMITTNDEEIAEKARLIRNHGSPKRYYHESLGYNFRMTDLQAAIGLTQLSKVDRWNAIRQENASYLTKNLKNIDRITTPNVRSGCEHVFHQYTIRINDRDKAIDKLTESGIGVGVYYPIPIHKQPLYKQLGYNDELINTEEACREVLSLPIHAALDTNDLDAIINGVSNL
jgi:dTDP-4-amino-4,6-dideoxygalactose transaminase